MAGARKHRSPLHASSAVSFRLTRSVLIALVITCLLTLLELILTWLLLPATPPGSHNDRRLAALLALLLNLPLVWLIPLAQALACATVVFALLRPLAILAYARAALQEQERRRSCVGAPYGSSLTYYQYTPQATAPQQQQGLTSVALATSLQQRSLLLMGPPGAGKTLALRQIHQVALRERSALMRGRAKIPIYLPLTYYSLFLKTERRRRKTLQRGSLQGYLSTGDLPGSSHLRPYLPGLLEQGRLILLCDGLDEVDPLYRTEIAEELAQLLQESTNLCVLTCREIDYQALPQLLALVDEGQIERALLQPLQLQQAREFIEHSFEDRQESRQYTAGQVMQFIEGGRLRHLCSTPFVLHALLEILGAQGIEGAGRLQTRGLLLQEFTLLLLGRVQKGAGQPAGGAIVEALGNIACAARLSHDTYAIDLSGFLAAARGSPGVEQVAIALLAWFQEQQAGGSLDATSAGLPQGPAQLARILDCATSAGLIEITDRGVMTFRHALIADYCVAAAVSRVVTAEQAVSSVLAGDLLQHVDAWANPVALWAGLLNNPLQLADWFVGAESSPELKAIGPLTLSLICVAVAWTPPQAMLSREDPSAARLLARLDEVIHSPDGREMLARCCSQGAAEGVQEMYYAMPQLLLVEGIEAFLLLLDKTAVAELLFRYLSDIVDLADFDAQLKRLCRILMHFGTSAVTRADQFSSPAASGSLRLRAAAINILGGTRSAAAVQPLLDRLTDDEQVIVERSITALQRLGPELNLPPLLRAFEKRAHDPAASRALASLQTILMRYITEKDPRKRLAFSHYERILQSAVALLGARYASETQAQRLAQELLVRLLRTSAPPAPPPSLALEAALETPASHAEIVLQEAYRVLLQLLSSGDEVLVDNVIQVLRLAGPAATPYLLEHMRRAEAEIVRARLLEILWEVRDTRALGDVLQLVADPSQLVQQRMLQAMRAFSPQSIPGLIELILTAPGEEAAARAAVMLVELGAEVVLPLSQALRSIVPARTRLLVQVAEQLHDERTLPALVNLLRAPQADALLTIALIRSLGQFATTEVVAPLIEALESPLPQIYEEAIDALSSVGSVALGSLLNALNVDGETIATPRIRRALLGMLPFPAEALVQALAQAGDAQARHIMSTLCVQGVDAASVLVRHLFDERQRVRGYVRQTLRAMPGASAVPALLEVLNRPSWRDDAAELLLGFAEAISALVNLLGDSERAEAAFAILPHFGPAVLTPLISALADARPGVQAYGRRIVVALVRQEPADIAGVVHLFSASLPARAHESLMQVLTADLVPESIPVLLEGLEDAYLVEHVSEALLRLERRPEWRSSVLEGLLTSLRREQHRRGAEIALIRMGAPAVRSVGELITDENRQVARASQHILLEIGAAALPFIWAAHGDTANRARREAAMQVFQSMATEAIKDALLELLNSEKTEDIAMAQALLLERVADESSLPQASHEMVPALLASVQSRAGEVAALRIVALLILLGGEAVVQHLVDALYARAEHHEQLLHTFLFLGGEAQGALQRILADAGAPARLRGEAVSMLGLLAPSQEVSGYARSLHSFGPANDRTASLQYAELTVALRALGSLLASGDWDIATLQNLQRISQEGSAEQELYQFLLGRRFRPELSRLQAELQMERDARKSEVLSLTARIVRNQEYIHELEEQLEQTRHEHGLRGDELFQLTQEREALRKELDAARQGRES